MDQPSGEHVGEQKQSSVIFFNECPKVVDRFRYENYEKKIKILAQENILKFLPDNSNYFQMSGLINQLIELNKTAQVRDISKTAIYISKDYRSKLRLNDGNIWRPRQLCDPLPYLVPAISGYAAILGLTENECRSYGQGNMEKEYIKRIYANDPTEQDLCSEAQQYGFRKILLLRNPTEIKQIDCQ